MIDQIKCPEQGCDNSIQYHELKSCIRKESFDKYERFAFENFKVDNPDERGKLNMVKCMTTLIKIIKMLLCLPKFFV